MNNYTESGCLAIMDAVFKKQLIKTKNKDDIKERLLYVDKSPIFQAWCEAQGEETDRLKNMVISRNHKFLTECQQS